MFEELIASVSRPFRATPAPAFFYPHDSIENVRQTVVRAAIRAEGPTVVLGGAGLGKSLLVELISDALRERFDIVRLSSTRLCSRRALLQNILFELGMEYRNLSEGELRLSILDRLEPAPDRAPDGVLFLVDEAHTLPVKLIDELRLINNFSRHGQPRTRLALFGNLRLEDTFAEPSLESFSQRLAARCYLQPMNKRDTAEFIRHQLSVAGANPGQVITQEGLDCIYAASEGVPRLANQVMDHALMLAIANCQSPISAALVEEAWADLQQLPAPWHSGHSSVAASPTAAVHREATTVVEFGALNDDPEWMEDDDTATSEPSSVPLNFFAAFSNTPDDDFVSVSLDGTTDGNVAEGTIDEERIDEGTIDEEVEQDVAPEAAVVQAMEPDSISNDGSISARYFGDRPSDAEMLAYEDEQNQYDTLGMWENDPPLTSLSPQVQKNMLPVEPSRTPFDTDEYDSLVHPASLFGEDFEEEIQVPNRPAATRVSEEALQGNSRGSQPDLRESNNSPAAPTKAAADQTSRQQVLQDAIGIDVGPVDAKSEEAGTLSPEDVNDYVLRLQEYANTFSKSQSEHCVGTAAPALEPQSNELDLGGWQVSTVGTDDMHALNIARDIEDLVSQLNFSAFSVEPYSVEQIPLVAPLPAADTRVEDAIRTGANEEVFVLHKPQELESRMVFNPSAADFDDDRDLLIIEDEVPATPKETNAAATQPPIKLSPYNQLFARLRK